MIKVSVVVPVYNVEKYLEQCVTSIINQTIKDIEIILINDNSQDSSNDICKEFLKKDSRISLYQSKGKGVSAARNIGIKKAKANWICFVDSDDWLEENMIEELYEIANGCNSDIIMCDTFVNRDEDQSIGEFYPEEKIFEGSDKEILQIHSINLLKEFQNTKIMQCGVPWGKLYRKELILKNNIKFKENLPRRQDAIFNLEAFEKANSINYKKINLYHYRRHKTSKVGRFAPNVCYEYNNIISEIEIFMEKYNKEKLLKESCEKIIIEYFYAFLKFFVHPDNNLSINDKLKEYEKNLNNNSFQNVLKNTNKHYKLKIFNLLCKKRIIIGLKLCCLLKRN